MHIQFIHSFYFLFRQSLQGSTTNMDMDTVDTTIYIKFLLNIKYCLNQALSSNSLKIKDPTV
jgi:spore coat protein CotF